MSCLGVTGPRPRHRSRAYLKPIEAVIMGTMITASTAIVVLIAFLITVNISAIWLRRRLEHQY